MFITGDLIPSRSLENMVTVLDINDISENIPEHKSGNNNRMSTIAMIGTHSNAE